MYAHSRPVDDRRPWHWRLLFGGLGVLFIWAGLSPPSQGTGSATDDLGSGVVMPLSLPEAGHETNGTARDTDGAGPADRTIALEPEMAPLAEEPVVVEKTPTDATVEPAQSASVFESFNGEPPFADDALAPNITLRYSRQLAPIRGTISTITPEQEAVLEPHDELPPDLKEHAITVASGDSLYTIFKAQGIPIADLAGMLALGSKTKKLARLRPGDRFTIYTDSDQRVQQLVYARARGEQLYVTRTKSQFDAQSKPLAAITRMPVAVEESATKLKIDSIPAQIVADVASLPYSTRSISVVRGDSLYSIFKTNGFPLADLTAILKSGAEAKRLSRLLPGQRIDFFLDSSLGVAKLVHYMDDTRSLHVTRNGHGYHNRILEEPLERRMVAAVGTIHSSLFLAGRRAGLSNQVIMQLVEIFGWDVDFALDIRAGDRFAVIYEELYKDDIKLRDGDIVAAEFINRGKSTRAVRYIFPEGRVAYFTPEGLSIRKTFLRTPVRFSRITSRFAFKRKHPRLHGFRAHHGVDYAAPAGTPIKAAGDGKVIFIGRKGGYGKTIVLRHGATYSTLYAHMSRYARGLKRGKRVSQGQIIGFVGATGVATGPHLHYEFRVRGVHRDPLRVKLPIAAPIDTKFKRDFQTTSRPFIDRLEVLAATMLAADDHVVTATD